MVAAKHMMDTADTVAIYVLLGLWFTLDVGVVIVDEPDPRAMHFLTNQVWVVSVAVKAALLVDMMKSHLVQPGCKQVNLVGWTVSLFFLVIGAAQAGVLGAFFTLMWLDSHLLDSMLSSGEHTLSEIVIWNHARHVTVCFVHLGVVWSMRHYLSCNSQGAHPLVGGCSTSYKGFCFLVVALPILGGLGHSWRFDDMRTYKYREEWVGRHCQLVFGLFSSIAAMYFLCVPMSSATKPSDTGPQPCVRVIVNGNCETRPLR